MHSLLVTGGAGFIGSNFIRYMLAAHPDLLIVNYDKLTYAGNLENLSGLENHPSYRFIRGDICDHETVARAMEEHSVDIIINFAAESHVDRSILGPAVFIETNVTGTTALLDAARKYGVARFVQISTDEVYGSLGEEGTFSETTPLHPNSPYAASKTSADLFVLAYQHTFGVPAVITRCSNNYGPYQFPEKLIPLMIVNALNDRPLPVYGDGGNVRDWIYVEDHCRAIDVVLHHGVAGEVYNIGGGNEWNNIDIVKLILRELGKPESLITFVKDRPGHDRRYAMDSRKITRELDWKPAKTFEGGLRETVRWYLDHAEWWKRILSGAYEEYYRTMYVERERSFR